MASTATIQSVSTVTFVFCLSLIQLRTSRIPVASAHTGSKEKQLETWKIAASVFTLVLLIIGRVDHSYPSPGFTNPHDLSKFLSWASFYSLRTISANTITSLTSNPLCFLTTSCLHFNNAQHNMISFHLFSASQLFNTLTIHYKNGIWISASQLTPIDRQHNWANVHVTRICIIFSGLLLHKWHNALTYTFFVRKRSFVGRQSVAALQMKIFNRGRDF